MLETKLPIEIRYEEMKNKISKLKAEIVEINTNRVRLLEEKVIELKSQIIQQSKDYNILTKQK